MPEVDLARYRVVGRGRHVEAAKRSFESVVLDRSAVKTLGGPDAIRELVATLARTVRDARKKHRAA